MDALLWALAGGAVRGGPPRRSARRREQIWHSFRDESLHDAEEHQSSQTQRVFAIGAKTACLPDWATQQTGYSLYHNTLGSMLHGKRTPVLSFSAILFKRCSVGALLPIDAGGHTHRAGEDPREGALIGKATFSGNTRQRQRRLVQQPLGVRDSGGAQHP